MRKNNQLLIGLTVMITCVLLGCTNSRKIQSPGQSPWPDNTRSSSGNETGTLAADQKQWLKDYGFCMCLLYGKAKDTVISHDISFGVLRDISDYTSDEYEKVDGMAKNFALRIAPTDIADYEDRKPVIFSCLEFQRSKELDSLVNAIKKVDVGTMTVKKQ